MSSIIIAGEIFESGKWEVVEKSNYQVKLNMHAKSAFKLLAKVSVKTSGRDISIVSSDTGTDAQNRSIATVTLHDAVHQTNIVVKVTNYNGNGQPIASSIFSSDSGGEDAYIQIHGIGSSDLGSLYEISAVVSPAAGRGQLVLQNPDPGACFMLLYSNIVSKKFKAEENSLHSTLAIGMRLLKCSSMLGENYSVMDALNGPASDESLTSMVNALMGTGSGDDPNKSSVAAASTSTIIIKPEAVDIQSVLDDVLLVQGFVSIVGVGKALQALKARTGKDDWPLDTPDDKMQAIDDLATGMYNAAVASPAGLMAGQGGESGSIIKNVDQTEVHAEFLNELFEAFSFSPDAIAELDKVLIAFVKGLSQITVQEYDRKETLHHMLYVPYFEKVTVPGTSDYALMAKTKFFFISAESSMMEWAVKTGKSSVEHKQLSMNVSWITYDSALVRETLASKKDALLKVVETATGQSFAEVSKKMQANSTTVEKK